MRLLFLGSPGEAVPFLEACAREHEVAAVLTQPDKPSGRGLKLSPPPVKLAAQRLGLRVLQPADPAEPAPELQALGADMAVVVAYGRILKPEVLASTRHGFLNVHFSLLPRWRGAAPVAWTLLSGERRSGVSLFWIEEGLDTGPLQRQAPEDVREDDDEPTLMSRLVDLGVRELGSALGEVAEGRVRREPQAGEPTRAPKLHAAIARLDFKQSAEEFHNRVRALQGGPKPYLLLKVPGREQPLRVAVLKTALEAGAEGPGEAGDLVRVERSRGILIRLRSGRLWISQVQPEGKKPVFSADFLNGLRLGPGGRLETLP
ncbi:MAG TPA: methionyl-tRNA formyltransferase [Elusimicrobia bacterium]|nr:methionyl-tRNA formyltransferase [Elusimicrobiota bacterium]